MNEEKEIVNELGRRGEASQARRMGNRQKNKSCSESATEDGTTFKAKKPMKTIKLSDSDISNLLFALGLAIGTVSKSGTKRYYFVPCPMSESSIVGLTDRILVQLDPNNYTYGKPRQEVVEDLKNDGIELSDY